MSGAEQAGDVGGGEVLHLRCWGSSGRSLMPAQRPDRCGTCACGVSLTSAFRISTACCAGDREHAIPAKMVKIGVARYKDVVTVPLVALYYHLQSSLHVHNNAGIW